MNLQIMLFQKHVIQNQVNQDESMKTDSLCPHVGKKTQTVSLDRTKATNWGPIVG